MTPKMKYAFKSLKYTGIIIFLIFLLLMILGDINLILTLLLCTSSIIFTVLFCTFLIINEK